jgi:hypothetical protein
MLDPIHLLQEIRNLQAKLAPGNTSDGATGGVRTNADFLRQLSGAWREGEVRPTHRKQRAPRYWRTHPDAFQIVWPKLLGWLDAQPDAAAKDLFLRLQQEMPGTFPDGQLRTFQRRIKEWREQMARRLIFGSNAQPQLYAAHAIAAAR